MPETSRVRPIEYHSPRGLILGICFVWGIGVGFVINFFRASESMDQPAPARTESAAAARPASTELERRRQDIPNVTEVAPTPVQAAAGRQTIEDVAVGPPPAVLTPEGGLTGKTAAPLGGTGRAARSAAINAGVPSPAVPPPIPDLSP